MVAAHDRASTSAEVARCEDGEVTGHGAEVAKVAVGVQTCCDTVRPFQRNCFSPFHSAGQSRKEQQAELCAGELTGRVIGYRSHLDEEEIEQATLVDAALGALRVMAREVAGEVVP